MDTTMAVLGVVLSAALVAVVLLRQWKLVGIVAAAGVATLLVFARPQQSGDPVACKDTYGPLALDQKSLNFLHMSCDHAYGNTAIPAEKAKAQCVLDRAHEPRSLAGFYSLASSCETAAKQAFPQPPPLPESCQTALDPFAYWTNLHGFADQYKTAAALCAARS